MISGMSRIWITLEMNSQNTKAIGGSNCHAGGASTFQPNQQTVHPKTVRKNPIEPTRIVIQSASRSSGVIASRTSLCSLRKGFRRLMTASTDGGCSDVAGDVVLTAETPLEVRRRMTIWTVGHKAPRIRLIAHPVPAISTKRQTRRSCCRWSARASARTPRPRQSPQVLVFHRQLKFLRGWFVPDVSPRGCTRQRSCGVSRRLALIHVQIRSPVALAS